MFWPSYETFRVWHDWLITDKHSDPFFCPSFASLGWHVNGWIII